MFLIVGAGFAGSYLIRRLNAAGRGPVLATVHSSSGLPGVGGAEYMVCDVTSDADVRALSARCGGEPLTVFYFAACHNVDHLYRHPLEAREVNIGGLARFLDTVPGIEKLFFASTDCVHGESAPGAPPLKETDPTLPVNEYGRQKLAAEALVRERGFTAVRFAYMLGPSLTGKPHFYDKICSALRAGEPVEMIDGMVRSALTYETAASLLGALSALPARDLPDTVNLCSDGAYTKYELGLAVARSIGAPEALVRPLPEAEGQKFFLDRRAKRTVMDNTRLKRLLGIGSVGLGL